MGVSEYASLNTHLNV